MMTPEIKSIIYKLWFDVYLLAIGNEDYTADEAKLEADAAVKKFKESFKADIQSN